MKPGVGSQPAESFAFGNEASAAAAVCEVFAHRQLRRPVKLPVDVSVETIHQLCARHGTVSTRGQSRRMASRRSRPRASRDITVPIGTSSAAAISLYDNPSSSRSTITSRKSAGSCSSAPRTRATGGMHFIGLVNVVNLKAGGLGVLGDQQLEWLERDLKRLRSSTPIVVFAHIPLWSVYSEWGWGTDDSARALSYVKRFGSVSVLNGHIHQVMQKVEGHVSFHTAMSTAFPQPAPGSAPSPGPMKVEADRLKKLLGLARMSFHDVNHPIAITDVPLDAG